MNSLQIPLIEIVDEGLRIDTDVAVRDLQPQGVETLPLERVRVAGVISAAGADYLFRGYVEGYFEHPCDRCLELARHPFRSDIVWNFEEGPLPEQGRRGIAVADEAEDDDTVECRTYQGGEIDLTLPIWEELVLAVPVKYLCDEECAGLCPQCGANLNLARCACGAQPSEEKNANRGLAGLADLFPDLAPKKKEE